MLQTKKMYANHFMHFLYPLDSKRIFSIKEFLIYCNDKISGNKIFLANKINEKHTYCERLYE